MQIIYSKYNYSCILNIENKSQVTEQRSNSSMCYMSE